MRQVLSKDYIWIDNQIKTLFFHCVSTLDDVTTIPSNIQATAFPKFNTKEQASVTSFVESRVGRCNIKTIYATLLWVPFKNLKLEAIPTSPCANLGLEVVDSDDEMLLTYIITAIKMNREIWLFYQMDERPCDERAEEAISKTRENMRKLTHKYTQWQEETGVRFKLAAKFGAGEHLYGPSSFWKELAGGRENGMVYVS
ncbi:hypothetical protein HG530_006845 [Fusarium avenaceum]|nr:hypothetical protein HG530_006845 [Fusarium avenaceum]KIL86928.1 hypothetical protein FAVG1_09481 [Fusarium avenaceum]